MRCAWSSSAPSLWARGCRAGAGRVGQGTRLQPQGEVSPPSTGPALMREPAIPSVRALHVVRCHGVPCCGLVGSRAVIGLLPAGALTSPTAHGDMAWRRPHPLP